MYRYADRPRLICNRASDGLADPPRGVGGELVATAVFELLDRLHQADIAFLNQVEERQPPVGVFLGNRYHKPQVGLDHLALGLVSLTGEVLQFPIGREVVLGGLPDKGLESGQFSFLALEHHVGLRRLGSLLQLLDGPEVLLHLVVDIVRDQAHFLDYFLFEKKLREVFLQFLIQFLECLAGLLRLGLGGSTPGSVFFVHLGVLLPHLFNEAVQRPDMFFTGLNYLVDRDPVKTFLGGIGGQLFSQGDVFLGGKAKAVQYTLDLQFGGLNPLGNLHLLLARQQRHLPHLLEVHANRVVENVQPAFFGLAL